MKKTISALAVMAALSSPALAGVWDMVGHLPTGIGASNMAVSHYFDASSAIEGIALIGGSTVAGDTNLAYYFNISDYSWGWLSNYPYSVSSAAAARAGDTLYVHGGWCSPNVKDSTFKYAEMIYSWGTTNMNSLTPRSSHGLVNLYNRYLYAVGGTNNIGQTTSSVERLDPQGGPPIYVQAMPQSRTCAVTVTAMGSDAKPHIYVLGGKDSLGNILNSVVEYDSGSGWTTKGTTMPVPRWNAAGAVVNGSIYLIGGVIDGSNTITRRVDIYNPITNSWVLGDSIPVKLFRAGACGIGNVIYLFGGSDPTVSQSDSVWQYRPFAPNPPALANPPQGLLINNQYQNFFWHPIAGAVGYMVQVTDDSTFGYISVVDNYVTDTSTVSLNPYLGSEGKYYWRVKAYLPADSSNWSPVRWLTLDLTPPGQPMLSLPADGSCINTTSVNFSWFAVDSAVAYHLQIDNADGSFTTTIINDSTISTTGANIDLSASGEDLYFWRARARDAAGNWSVWSTVPTFTVDQTSPWVNYNEPYDGEISVAVGRNIVIGFSEPIDYPTAGNFAFTCSPDPFGWFESWNITGDTVTLTHNDFAAGQFVSFTVTTARDLAGNNQVSSYAWNFTTEANDVTPPEIATPYCNNEALLYNNNYTFQVYITDQGGSGVGVDSAVVRWGTAGYNGYNFSRKLNLYAGDVYQAYIYSNEIGMQGVQYQVEAWDLAGNSSLYPGPTYDDYYIHSVRYSGQYLNTAVPYDVWLMLSIPSDAKGANIFGMLSNDLGAYDPKIWRLFEWVPTGYLEIKDFANGWINDFGKAYWLRHRWGSAGPITVYLEGVDSSYGNFTNSTCANVTLNSGWNDVGTPFQFNIPWSNVTVTPGATVAGPYFYNGSRWMDPGETVTSTSFSPFKGYAYKNDDAITAYLSITPSVAKKKGSASASFDSPVGWKVLVKIENANGQDHNYFGVGVGALNERDQYDYPEPPSGLTGTAGYFRLADGQFCTDIRPELGEGQTWNFAVDCYGQTKLTITLPVEFPAGTECYLADLSRQVSVNIKDNNTYSFIPEPGEKVREFKIIAGPVDYAKGVLGSSFALPAVTVLMQNRPNPLRDNTTINYQLSADGPVKLAIYNVAGQLVKTLVNRTQMAGRYAVTWNGRDESGRQAATGVYFYRLTSNNGSAARTMNLIK